ncbi:hypothetical protein IMY05_010G0025500 [Salix suchowensis]|nr:hypothetical protein IMY05_010G0025500 [Salix suchowensis]
MRKENSKRRKSSRVARSFRYQMEQSVDSSAVFSANQSIVCIHDLELEITREKCTMKGQVAILPSSCRSGITMQSYTEKEGLKITRFIITEHVPARGDIQPPRAALPRPLLPVMLLPRPLLRLYSFKYKSCMMRMMFKDL